MGINFLSIFSCIIASNFPIFISSVYNPVLFIRNRAANSESMTRRSHKTRRRTEKQKR